MKIKVLLSITVMLIITFSFSALAQESVILTKGKQTRIPKGDVLEVTYGTGLGASGVLQFTPEGQPILVPGVDKSIQYAINFEQTDAVLLPRKNRMLNALLWGVAAGTVATGIQLAIDPSGERQTYASGFGLGMFIGVFTGRQLLNDKRSFRKSKGWRFEVR